MVQRRGKILAVSAIYGAGQALISGVVIFVIYREVNRTVGVSAFGVWAVIYSFVTFAKLANFGLGLGVPKYLASAAECGGDGWQLVTSAAAGTFVVLSIVGAAGYYPACHLLPRVFRGSDLALAHSLLKYAFVQLVVTETAAIFQTALDGIMRTKTRALINIGGQIFSLALTIILMPKIGLLGFVYAQLLQQFGVLVFAGGVAKNALAPDAKNFPTVKVRYLSQLARYGWSLQVSTLFLLLTDPFVKGLVAATAGAANAGYFEIANQIYSRLRILGNSASQALVGGYAHAAQEGSGGVKALYAANLRLLVAAMLPLTALTLLWLPVIAHLLSISNAIEFERLAVILFAPAAMVTLSLPAYVMNIATGRAYVNTGAQMAAGAAVVLSSIVLSKIGWGNGVAFGYAIGISVANWGLLHVQARFIGVRIRGIVWLNRFSVVAAAACATYAIGNLEVGGGAWFGGVGLRIAFTALAVASIVYDIRSFLMAKRVAAGELRKR